MPISKDWGETIALIWARTIGANPVTLNRGEGEFLLGPGGCKFVRSRTGQVLLYGYGEHDLIETEDWVESVEQRLTQSLGLPYKINVLTRDIEEYKYVDTPTPVGITYRSPLTGRMAHPNARFRRGMGR